MAAANPPAQPASPNPASVHKDRRKSSLPVNDGSHPPDFSDANGIVSPHSLPPAVLRLLSLSSPLISALDNFLQLATWTGPNGGGTRSTLLLLVWTGLCLFAYPLLRYAPQLILLSVILASAVPNLLLTTASSKRNRRKTTPTIPTLTASTLTQTQAVELLQKLSSILDVFSTLHAYLILPVWQALTWQHPDGPSVTIGTAIVCLTLGSLWTVCFADWPSAWAKVVTVLPLDPTYELVHQASQSGSQTIQNIWAAHFKFHYEQAGSPQFRKMLAFILIHARNAYFWLAANIGKALPPAWLVAVLPPFPLFSLNLSHFFLTLGLVAFSWCSTYATLVRHALWKSAVIRRITRTGVRLLSAGYLGQDTHSHLARSLATSGVMDEKKGASGSSSSTNRINTVSYRFELYENQRWWMGLDWTAALLPQERASWTDVNLAPVSPPSSFTLPAETTTMRPAPTKEKPNAWEKRTVRWKWEEEEWRVVVNGAGGMGGSVVGDDGQPLATTTSSGTPNRRASSSGAAPASPGTASTLFSSFGKRSSISSPSPSRSPSAQVAGAGSAIPAGQADASALDSALDEFNERGGETVDDDLLLEEETDSQGWRYGDNSWEKLTSKSGMGKYTRRRRWVRRARMEEIVEGGLEAPGATGNSNAKADAGKKSGVIVSGSEEKQQSQQSQPLVASPVNEEPPSSSSPKLLADSSSTPSTPTPAQKKDLKSRLAGAAGGTSAGSGGGGT